MGFDAQKWQNAIIDPNINLNIYVCGLWSGVHLLDLFRDPSVDVGSKFVN